MIKREEKKEFEEEMKFDNPFFQDCYDVVHKDNRNLMIVIVGAAGRGKSYVALKIASELDKSFNYDTLKDRLINKPQKMISKINEERLKRGNAIVFDEAGVGISAREWYSFNNKAINYIVQTFRFRNLITIFTVPYLNYIDSNVRKMFDYVVECISINKDERLNKVRILRLEYNKISGDFYNRYPLYKVGNNIIKIKAFYLHRAKTKLINEYERLSQKFKKEIGYDLERVAGKIEKKEEKRDFDAHKIAKEVYKNLGRYIQKYGKREFINSIRIETDYDIGKRRADKVKTIVKEMAKMKN